ncbi:MAG: lipopolysaccharide biosynthesis protein [Atopobiaceae bacterium]
MARDLKSTTVKSLFWKLFEQGGSAAIQLIVQIVMARLLAPHEFGMLAIMVVFVNIGNVIVQSGLNTAIIQAPTIEEKDCSTVFWMSLSISVVLYGIVFALAPAVAQFYSMADIVWPLRVLVLILIVNAYNAIQEALVARHMDFKKTFRATVIAAAVSGVSGISTALLGGGIWALVVQQLSFQVAKCVVLMVEIPWKPHFEFSVARARVMFNFGWKLLASGLIDQGYTSLSSLVIGRQFSGSELGFVTQGERYPQAIGIVLDGAIQPVMLSAVSRVQAAPEQVKRLARRGLKTSTFLIVPAMGAFALVAEPLVLLLLGDKWLPAVPFLQMYCLIYAFLPIHTTNLQVLNGMGKSDIFLKLEVIKKGIGIVMLCITAFVIHNLYAIVIGYIINNVISTFINAEPNRKVIGYSYLEQVKDICPAFILTAAAAAVAWPLALLALPRLALVVLQVLVMGGAYVVLAWVFKVEEFSYLKRNAQAILSQHRPGASEE